MLLIAIGLFFWCFAHLIPSILPGVKTCIIQSKGDNAYKGIIAASVFTGLVLIVIGWRSSIPNFVYVSPPGLRHVTYTLVLIAFILLGAANYPNRIKNTVRHPMLLGVMVWSIGHLLSNGESRSILLFGTLGIWALAEIILINRRDKDWQKGETPSWTREIRGALISIVVFVVFMFLHPFYTGIPLINW